MIPVLSYERKKLYVLSLLVERREREVAKDFKRKRIVIFFVAVVVVVVDAHSRCNSGRQENRKRRWDLAMFTKSAVYLARSAVAFFNMKHFQSKQKLLLTPENFMDIMSTVLHPRDRLLRHSIAGGGSTRILVLDRNQKVKGVCSPLLCFPHPSTVHGGDNVLGIAVEDYLRAIEPKGGVAPTVLAVLSHPNGVALATFGMNGSIKMPLENIVHKQDLSLTSSSSTETSGMGEVFGLLQSGPLSLQLLSRVQTVLNREYNSHIKNCSSFYWVMRGKQDSLSLSSIRGLEKRQTEVVDITPATMGSGKSDVKAESLVSFTDKRWISVPDIVLQQGKGPGLYTRDTTTNERIVNAAGLQAAVSTGALLLDSLPHSNERPL